MKKSIRNLKNFIFAFSFTFSLGVLPGHLHAQVASDSYKIMPLGDSITDGFTTPGGYRIQLWNDALLSGWKIEFVGSRSNGPDSLGSKHHEGYPRYRIDQISALVDDKIATYNPQMILLEIGTNDILQSYDLDNAPYRLQSLIEQILQDSPSVQLVVATITPLTYTSLTRRNAVIENAEVQTYNAAIPGIVSYEQSLGYNITLVDLYNALDQYSLVGYIQGSSDLQYDGIHPSPQGYGKMGDTWATAIQVLLPDNSQSLVPSISSR